MTHSPWLIQIHVGDPENVLGCEAIGESCRSLFAKPVVFCHREGLLPAFGDPVGAHQAAWNTYRRGRSNLARHHRDFWSGLEGTIRALELSGSVLDWL